MIEIEGIKPAETDYRTLYIKTKKENIKYKETIKLLKNNLRVFIKLLEKLDAKNVLNELRKEI